MLKQKLKISLFALLAIVLCGVMATSCSGNNDYGGYPDDICIDFATFVSTSDNGSVFTLRKTGDSPLITLTAAVKIDTSKLKPDTRVLIQYVPSGGQAPYESGSITLYGIAMIVTGDIEPQSPATIESWPSSPVKMTSMTRSGVYLDVWAQGDYDSKITRFCLAADENTLEDEYPRLYLVFEGDSGIGYPHQLYASFNLSDAWLRETCKGVIIRYQTASGSNTVTLNKTNNQ